jgi:DNA-binding SARP family transcriptional activator/WD40 repeat protein
MEFRVLGPLEVVRDARPVELGAGKQRALLAVLLCHRNTPVPSERLVDALWGPTPPRTAADNLRVYVYHLRRALGDGNRITRHRHGYAALVAPGELDADRFAELAGQGQEASDHLAAAAKFRQALDLWRGAPYLDVAGVPTLHGEIRRLEEQRQAVLELRVDADLAAGRHAELVAELSGLAAHHPLRERLHTQLMLALDRAGRRAEALEVFARLRARLADELGLDPSERTWRVQAEILRGDAAAEPPAERRPVGPAVCPYPGLVPFDVADAPLFFGRERLLAEGMARLAAHRLLAVVGPSGSGKSSLARAGLLARLARDHGTAVRRPGAHPLTRLPARLAERGAPFVLLVDQCEEAFTECADAEERARFFDALTSAAADPARHVLIIVVLRADYYGRCAAHPALAEALGRAQVLVGPLGEAELRRAVERPADLTGLRVAEGLSDALVADVAGRSGALPLLATALRELWERAEDGLLTLDDYVATGGVQGAVARLAERAYQRLSPARRDLARRILLRLAAPGDGDTMVRRRAPRAELAAVGGGDLDAVLSTLTAHRLVNVGDGAVEIAHEAVLAEWPRLREWLTEDLAGLRLHRTLTAAATAWASGGRAQEDLLRGVRLSAAVEWAGPRTADLTPLEAEFLAASGEAADRAVRQLRARARAQSRANRRLRWLVVALVAALAGAVAAGGAALVQRDRAEERTRAAHGRELAARSATEADLDRSLLLAVAATRVDDSPAATGALMSALVRADHLSAVTPLPVPVVGTALAPGGRFLYASGFDGTVLRVDLATRGSVALDRVANSTLGRPAISPDGRTLAVGATGSGHARVLFWDLATGRRIGAHPVGAQLPVAAAWRPDGRVVALTVRDEIVLVDVVAPAWERRIPFPGLTASHAADVVFTPAGLVVAGSSGTAVFDPGTGAALHSADIGGPLAVSPAGDAVFLGGGQSTTPAVLDLGTGGIRGRLDPLPSMVSQVAWRGDTLVAAGLDLVVRVWDARGPAGPATTLRGHTANITGLTFAADGRTLYTSGLDQRVLTWDLSGDRRFRRTVHTGITTFDPLPSSFHPNGSLIAIADRPGRVTLHDTATGGPVGTLTSTSQDTRITALAFSPDGSTLAAGDAAGMVWRWDVTHRRPLGEPRPTGSQALRVLRFSPDGRSLLTSDLRTGVRLSGAGPDRRLPGPAQLTDAQFAGPALVAVAGRDGAIQLVRLTADGPRRDWRIPLSTRAYRLVATGDRLLATDVAGWLHGWDLTARRELWPARRVPGGIASAMSVDPGGRQVAVSAGESVHLWDVSTGRRVTDLPQPPQVTPAEITFVREGRRLLVMGDSGTLVDWDLDPESWRGIACAIVDRELTPVEWAELGVPAPDTLLCGDR